MIFVTKYLCVALESKTFLGTTKWYAISFTMYGSFPCCCFFRQFYKGDNCSHWAFGPKMRRINVDATSSRRIDVNTTSFLRHVPAGLASYLISYMKQSFQNGIYWVIKENNCLKFFFLFFFFHFRVNSRLEGVANEQTKTVE